MSKEELRARYIAIRKEIDDKFIRSEEICKEIVSLEEFSKANTIALYISLKDEVSTDYLIRESLLRGKMVAFPRVHGEQLRFYKYNLSDKLEKSRFGVYEPLESSEYIDKNRIDLIIVPGICFDKSGNRLGFGKGYYDRYLKNMRGLSIGICFKEQIVDLVETDENDVRIKRLIYK